MILKSWREVDYGDGLEIVREDVQTLRTEVPTKKVIVGNEKSRAQLGGGLLDGILRRGGYRFVERLPALRASRYVRPLPLWFLHRTGLFLLTMYWGILDRLYHVGIIHFAKDEGVVVTWRDIRLGRLR